jgi:hypothetical protein
MNIIRCDNEIILFPHIGLLESIRYRTEILSENEFTHKECELIQAQFSHDSKLRVEEFTQKIKNYMVKLNELGAKTKQNHEKVGMIDGL